jgi:hypothetical protein
VTSDYLARYGMLFLDEQPAFNCGRLEIEGRPLDKGAGHYQLRSVQLGPTGICYNYFVARPKGVTARQYRQVWSGSVSRRVGRADGLHANGLRIAPLAVLHVGKVVAKCRDTGFGHSIGDRLQGGMAHVGACPVAKNQQMARCAGPNQDGGNLALFCRGDEFEFFAEPSQNDSYQRAAPSGLRSESQLKIRSISVSACADG